MTLPFSRARKAKTMDIREEAPVQTNQRTAVLILAAVLGLGAAWANLKSDVRQHTAQISALSKSVTDDHDILTRVEAGVEYLTGPRPRHAGEASPAEPSPNK